MEDELTEEEREHMRKFSAFQRVVLGIVLKWLWLFFLVFVLLSCAFSGVLVWRAAKSGHRFDATTRLIFTPRQFNRVQNMTDKQLMSVLERPSLKRRVGRSMSMPMSERECLLLDLNIKQERKPTNLYTLTARAPSWVGAVKKVNTYAEVLIAEYVAYRTHDLVAWSEAIEVRKKSLQEQIATIEAEETVAKSEAGVASPAETLTMLNMLLSDQRRNSSMLSVQIANEEVKRKKLEDVVGGVGQAIVACAPAIRKKIADLAAIDDELAKLREIYTDLNPKVKGKLDDRDSVMKEYEAILKANNITGLALADVERIEKAASELAELNLRVEVLEENQRSLEQEMKSNEERSSVLTAVIPTLERLRVKREELERTMRELDEQLDDLDYLRVTAGNDLKQIERAGGAGDKNPLSPKNFALAGAGAVACTLALLFWVVVLELIYGKVRGAAELTAFGDVTHIGSLPADGAMSASDEKDVFGVVALNFCNVELPKGTVLVCRLQGSPEQPKFAASLDWSLAMAGQRSFVLHIVQSLSFEPTDDCELMINTVRKASHGWFPVANRFALAPTELQMLQADLAALHGEFDCIFMVMPDGLRRGGNFFSQLLGISESVLLMVGANATPRAELAYVRRHVASSGKPMMSLVTGASKRVVQREMEEVK